MQASTTVSDETLFLQPLAAVLERLPRVLLPDVTLLRPPSAWLPHSAKGGTHRVRCLQPHIPTARRRLPLKKTSVSAVHADAIVGLEVPSAVGPDALQEGEAEEGGQELHGGEVKPQA